MPHARQPQTLDAPTLDGFSGAIQQTALIPASSSLILETGGHVPVTTLPLVMGGSGVTISDSSSTTVDPAPTASTSSDGSRMQNAVRFSGGTLVGITLGSIIGAIVLFTCLYEVRRNMRNRRHTSGTRLLQIHGERIGLHLTHRHAVRLIMMAHFIQPR